jgi:hypothetical protein
MTCDIRHLPTELIGSHNWIIGCTCGPRIDQDPFLPSIADKTSNLGIRLHGEFQHFLKPLAGDRRVALCEA